MPVEVVVTPSGTLRGEVHEGVAEFKGIPYGSAERFRPPVAAAVAMADALVAFATAGDPSTPALDPWPTYDTHRRATMRLDTESVVVDDPHGDERRVWNG